MMVVKKKRKTFRLYLRWLVRGKGKLLELRANLRSTDKSQDQGPVQTVSDTKELFPSRQLYRTSIWNCELDEKHEKGRKHADSILYIFLLGLLQITCKLSWYSVHRSFSYKANGPLSGFSFGPILRLALFCQSQVPGRIQCGLVRIVLRSKNLFEDALRVSWTILLKIKMKLVTMRQDRIQIGENTERSRLVVNLQLGKIYSLLSLYHLSRTYSLWMAGDRDFFTVFFWLDRGVSLMPFGFSLYQDQRLCCHFYKKTCILLRCESTN